MGLKLRYKNWKVWVQWRIKFRCLHCSCETLAVNTPSLPFPSCDTHLHTPSNQILSAHPVKCGDSDVWPLYYHSANNSIKLTNMKLYIFSLFGNKKRRSCFHLIKQLKFSPSEGCCSLRHRGPFTNHRCYSRTATCSINFLCVCMHTFPCSGKTCSHTFFS